MARNAVVAAGGSTVRSTIAQCHTFPSIRVEQPNVRVQDKPYSEPSSPDASDELTSVAQIPRPKPPPPPPKPIRANGNGIMKEPRTTIVNFDFAEEPIPPSHYFCGTVKVQKLCRIVAFLCLASFATNCILYSLGFSRLGLNGYFEFFFLFFDFATVVSLLIGVSKKKSGLLKPFLIFNVLWSIGLIILFFVGMWHFLKGSSAVSTKILENIRSLKPSAEEFSFMSNGPENRTVAVLASLAVMTGLALVIVVDCLFLHVAYRTFQFFSYKEEKKREEIDKKDPL